MGRRLFYLLGVIVLFSPALVGAQGWQEAAPVVEAREPEPLPAVGGDLDAPAALPSPEDPRFDEPLDVTAPAPLGEPAALDMGELDARPPLDEEVQQVQGAATPPPAPAAAPAPAPVPDPAGAGTIPGGIPTPLIDQLPMGRHEELVSVEVQAPETMNIDMESTVKIIVRNAGSSDALGVVVRDELPEGLEFVSSVPETQPVNGSLLTWSLGTLPSGTDKVILVKVKPTRSVPLDHVATVTFQAGSRARSRVLQPKLRVEIIQTPSLPQVLKGRRAEFRISVTNTGDGPARDVLVLAKLSPGLALEGESNETNSYDLPIKMIGPGQREDLPPMVVDARLGGTQTCLVRATSPDVVYNEAEAQAERAFEVVEPLLKLALDAPAKRYTDTVAEYAVNVENPGTAPAKNVQVTAAIPIGGRLVAVPSGARYDAPSRRLFWTIPQIDPGSPARSFPFEVRMGGVGYYEVTAEAKADGGIQERDKRSTDVQGMADLDLVVRERRRVVDVDGTTTFQIRLQNYGTKEAANIQLRAEVSSNLQIIETGGGPEKEAKGTPDGLQIAFPTIDRIPAGKEMILGIKVKVTSHDTRIGTCRVYVKHDDLPQEIDDMATVKLTEGRQTAAAAEPTAQ